MLSKTLLFPRLVTKASVIVRAIHVSAVQQGGGHHVEHWWGPEKNNGREVVGWGVTGDETYMDRIDYWYPAIRFRKDDDIILPIREKEKGDWKKLSIDEKKTLYRYSYKQTLAEFEAPTGYWKLTTATVCFVLSLAFFYMTFLKLYVLPPLPMTNVNEWKEMEVERMLVLEKGQFLGAPKYFDYDNNEWKK